MLLILETASGSEEVEARTGRKEGSVAAGGGFNRSLSINLRLWGFNVTRGAFYQGRISRYCC